MHIALHGCLQSFGNIGEDYVRHAGYNEWADSNHIIVLYPQTTRRRLPRCGMTNPQACWDWWGYLDADPDGLADLSTEVGQAGHGDQGDARPGDRRGSRGGGGGRAGLGRPGGAAGDGRERYGDRPGVDAGRRGRRV